MHSLVTIQKMTDMAQVSSIMVQVWLHDIKKQSIAKYSCRQKQNWKITL